MRDELLRCGVVDRIDTILAAKKIKLTVARLVSWIISNLLKGFPPVPIEIVVWPVSG